MSSTTHFGLFRPCSPVLQRSVSDDCHQTWRNDRGIREREKGVFLKIYYKYKKKGNPSSGSRKKVIVIVFTCISCDPAGVRVTREIRGSGVVLWLTKGLPYPFLTSQMLSEC
jgi:hypothetical protein